MATPTVFLPLELWLHVLRQHTDPLHLWLSCRQVSSAWRNEVNLIFGARYLQDPQMTELQFDMGKEFTCLTMHFDRFDDEDPARCVFVEDENSFDLTEEAFIEHLMSGTSADTRKRLARNKLRIRLGCYLGIDRTEHTIRVKKVVNDTELPGLRLDYSTQELSFRWLDMFACLFREEQALESISMRSLLEHLTASKNDDAEIMATVSQHFDNRGQLRKQIRRKRIMLWYKQNLNHDMPDDAIGTVSEGAAFDRMKAVEQQLSLVEFPEDADEIRAAKEQDELERQEVDEKYLEEDDDANNEDEGDHDEENEHEDNQTEDGESDEEPMRKRLKREEFDDIFEH